MGAGWAAGPTRGHGQSLQTTPQGRMLQQPLALLRHGIFLKDSPASGPAEPREGRWELLRQPPTPGDAQLPWQCPPAQHKVGAARGAGIRGQPEEQWDAHSSCGIIPKARMVGHAQGFQSQLSLPGPAPGAEKGSALAPPGA